jgi:membrane protein
MKFVRQFAVELWRAIDRNRDLDMAAELAYWSLLAVFPFAIFVLTVVGYVPLHGLDRQLLDIEYSVMPREAAELFDRTVHEVVGRQRGALLVLSLLGAVWTASGAVSGATKALNNAYGVAESRPYWRRKLLALRMTVYAGVLSVVATAALIIGPEIAHHVFAWVGLGTTFDALWTLVRWPVVVAAMMIMLAEFYYYLPNFKHRFHLVSVGAVVSVLLWIGVSLGFNSYVSHFNSYAMTYGTLGAAMVLLTWLYLSGLLVILGGEINAILARMTARGEAPRPAAGDLSASEPT